MPQVGDIGTVFTGTVKEDGTVVDLTGGGDTTAQMIFNPPRGAAVTKTSSDGVAISTPANGKVTYTGESGLLTVSGRWAVQVRVDLSSPTRTFWSKLKHFDVGPQLS